MRRILALVFLCLLFAGCGRSGIKEGTVTSKEYHASYTNTSLWPIIIGEICTKYGCTPIISMIPYTTYHPERYVLDLEACALDKNGENKCKTGHAYVDPETYNRVKVGSFYSTLKKQRNPLPNVRLNRA